MNSTDNQITELLKPLHSIKTIMNAIAMSLVFVGAVIIIGAVALAINSQSVAALNGVEYLKALVYDPLFGALVMVAGVLVLRGMKKVEDAMKTNESQDAQSAIRYVASGAGLLSVATLLVSLFLFTEMWFMEYLTVCMNTCP